MRKFLLLIMLGLLFAFPASVFAQSDLKLTNVNVQLWPEYDQPSMLVITDFEIPATTALPVNVTFRIPKDANLIAVAVYSADGALTNAIFEGPQEDGEWQSFTVSLDSTAGRFEYYQTLSFNGNQRIFSYLWDGIYAVDTFAIRVLEPFDTTSLKTDPALTSISQESNLKYYEGEPVALASGEQFILNLEYEKTTDTLIVNTQGVQPSAPVDENTPGRVSLSNSLPYIIGGLGVIMIVGGVVYYWQSGRRSTGGKSRKRSRSHAEEQEDGEETYCPQCGSRSKTGDRFCRTCGARLRHQEE